VSAPAARSCLWSLISFPRVLFVTPSIPCNKLLDAPSPIGSRDLAVRECDVSGLSCFLIETPNQRLLSNLFQSFLKPLRDRCRSANVPPLSSIGGGRTKSPAYNSRPRWVSPARFPQKLFCSSPLVEVGGPLLNYSAFTGFLPTVGPLRRYFHHIEFFAPRAP